MLKFICLLAFATSCYAASIGTVDKTDTTDIPDTAEKPTTERPEVVSVLKYESDRQPDGSFHFMYEGGDNSFRQETGIMTNPGTDDEALEVSGSYRYIDADGREVEVHYTAGKNGFVPVGTNILSQISDAAKAAGDIVDNTIDEELNRKGRSRETENQVTETEKVATGTKVESIATVPKTKIHADVLKKTVEEKGGLIEVKVVEAAEPEVVPVKSEEVPEVKPEVVPEVKSEVKSEVVPETAPEIKPELTTATPVKSETEKKTDSTEKTVEKPVAVKAEKPAVTEKKA